MTAERARAITPASHGRARMQHDSAAVPLVFLHRSGMVGAAALPSGAVSGLRVLVVDDERLARDDLSWLLRQCDDVDEVTTAAGGQDALRVMTDREFDAVFLDIRMPGLDGVELVRVLRNFRRPPAVAFVTAYDDYAVDAFDLDVCDYLKKPVEQDRLEETLRRIRTRSPAPGDQPTEPGDGHAPLRRLSARRGNESFEVERDDIVVVEASGDYVRIHTGDDSALVRESISSLTSAWSGCGFIRVHRSYLVRVAAIDRMTVVDGRRSIEVAGVEYPVSRRYTRLLLDRMNPRP